MFSLYNDTVSVFKQFSEKALSKALYSIRIR